MRRAVGLLDSQGDLAEGLGYSFKRRLLGRPLVNEQLGEQRLSKPLALGVLAPDGISSSAYGTEEILIELLKGGLAITAFTLILPMTGVVLFVMALVVLSYREVVTVYTRAGGSYVVARDNFGPRVAQIAAVALLIDYVVTVAVQVAAGTAAVASAWTTINHATTITVISVVIVALMCYGNLRGIREAGRSFALPTYLFSGIVIIMIVTGLIREAAGALPRYRYPIPGQYGVHTAHSTSGLIAFGMVFVLLRAFANGGSSLTGIEAVSNAVSAFRPPEGRNARRVLVAEGVILGSLVAGISWLAHATHAAPFTSGVPTVISQEAKIVFGSGIGHVMFIVVQAATALILYTGGNTSFNGFPFLASFVAEDAFLPRWLTKRGHRLVFSNGIVVLAVLSATLLGVVGANVNRLVPFYAIGVFTAFTMAGFGMARYHHRTREPGWRRRLVINFSAGVTSAVVVLIFVVVKFTEGAWLVVILFAAGVPALIRLNREYQMEAGVLARIGARSKPPEPPTYSRRTVFVFVDNFDLATIAALRYARSLRPTTLRAVHFVIDNTQADTLRRDWVRANTGIVLDFVDCADRRLARCAAELVSAEAELPGVGVTAILPRRTYSTILGRLLHDRTADKIAAAVSRIPHAAATIVPFDVRNRVEAIWGRRAAAEERQPVPKAGAKPGAPKLAPVPPAEGDAVPAGTRPAGDGRPPAPAKPAPPAKPAGPGKPAEPAEVDSATVPAQGSDSAQVTEDGDAQPAQQALAADAADMTAAELAVADAATADAGLAADGGQYDRPVPPPGVRPIGSLTKPGKATVEGRVYAVEIRPVERNTVLAAEIADSTGHMTALFYGRSHIAGLDCGCRVRFRGQVGMRPDGPVMINPAYELVAPGTAEPPPASGSPGEDGPPPDSPRRRGGPRRRK
ncbi:MAG TPA: amino acid permease, partial [Streptosporangiaceae bacterium]|nr:amino acid permease [Streptosporangiaceae bacterium]